MTLLIDHTTELSLVEIIAVGRGEVQVALSKETHSMLLERRQQIESTIMDQNIPAYGFNRGFGHNVDLAVNSQFLSALQQNLILSHAVGVGESMDETVVRMTMLLRANSLARGLSGIRPELIEILLELLNAGITPIVPELGSVGASGDLAPLSHIAMVLIGQGRVLYNGHNLSSQEAFTQVGIKPIELEMKEGLALTNGVQFMNAIGLFACAQLKSLLKTAAINSALVAQVMLAPDTYFRADFHAARPHPGATHIAKWIWDMMQDSPIRNAHRDFETDGQVQDPYNIRCAAQILGAAYELIHQAEQSLIIEANSATDNPLLLPDREGRHIDVVSGGHFHGMPIAISLYNLVQSLGVIANLAHQRSARFVDPARNKGLGRDLKWPRLSNHENAISSGLMMLEYTSASLLNSIWGESTPSHLFNIPTNSGHEDHVSMGTGLAVRLLKMLPKASHILAIELAYILQGVAIRKELKSIPTEAEIPDWVERELSELNSRMNNDAKKIVFDVSVQCAHTVTHEEKVFSPVAEALFSNLQAMGIFPVVKHDRYLADDVTKLAQCVTQGEIVALVEEHLPLLW